MKGKGYITFMVAAALSMGLAVTAMAEEPGSGEPGGAQLGTMIEMADRLAPEGEDAAVISHIKGVTDSQGRLAVPMYQDAELVSVQAEAGTLKGEPKEQHSGMTSYLVADFDEADFPAVAVYLTGAEYTGEELDSDTWQAELHIEVFLPAQVPDSELDAWMESRIYPVMSDIPALSDLITSMVASGYDYRRDDDAGLWSSADLTYVITYEM